MEKEILAKIYMLRKVKADAIWKEEAKREILLSSPAKRVEEKSSLLFSPVFENNGFVMAGDFAFLLFFTYSVLPLLPDYSNQYVYDPYIEIATEDDISVVPEEEEDVDKNNKSIATLEKPITEEYSALQDSVREVQRAVFGMMIKGDSESEYQRKENLTDEDIANYLVAKMKEEAGGEEEEIMIMTVEEDSTDKDKEENKVERAEKALEDKDYGKIFDIYLEEI